MIDTYIKKIASITKRGDAREESYYPALAELLEEFSETKRKKKAHVTVLPKKTEAGNPDFRVWDGKHSQVGYVEAKQPRANLSLVYWVCWVHYLKFAIRNPHSKFRN